MKRRRTARATTTRAAMLFPALLTLGAITASTPPGGLSAVPIPSARTAVAQETESVQTTEETTVVVRAVAHDAKVIGSGVGGARVTIRHAGTGEVLARGVQEGGTGSTERIMREPRRRGAAVYAAGGAAKYEATLDLAEPTRVEIVAEGPLEPPHATQRASRTMLLVPGRDVTGEGVVLELYGFTVELERPGDGAGLVAGRATPVRAQVTMLCGCPIEAGGLWDADRIDVRARLVRGGRVVRETALEYAGRTSTFEGSIAPPGRGTFELVVVASDPGRANFGWVSREVSVDAPAP